MPALLAFSITKDGEVLPQAICSRYGLMVGAYSSWFVSMLMTLTMPVSLPIAKLLDILLGPHHSALFRRAELKALVDVHANTAGFGGTLTAEEIHVIRGALDLTSKTATKAMTPLDKVFMLSTDDRLDERCLQAVLMSGHSRIPVFQKGNRHDIVGVILAKELVLINPGGSMSVRELRTRPLPHLSADTPMYDMLRIFRTGKSHMALLTMPWSVADLKKTQRSPAVGECPLYATHGGGALLLFFTRAFACPDVQAACGIHRISAIPYVNLLMPLINSRLGSSLWYDDMCAQIERISSSAFCFCLLIPVLVPEECMPQSVALSNPKQPMSARVMAVGAHARNAESESELQGADP
eukprot:349801-Chlamydomonas_euryale.AAC.42